MITPSIHQIGDIITWSFNLNKSSGPPNNYTITIVTPPGVTYNPGSFVSTKLGATFVDPTITVPTMTAIESANFELKFTVNSILPTYTFTATAATDGTPGNNIDTAIVTYEDCPPMAGAIDDPNSCLCYNLASNDTQCSHCATEWRIVAGSEVNVVVNTHSITAGTGNVSLIDGSLPGSFQYYIWCVCSGGAQYQASGPATVSFNALFLTLPSKTFEVEDFGANAGDTVFNLAFAPLLTDDIEVEVGSVNIPATDYTLVGNVVTLANPVTLPVNGNGPINVRITYFR